MNPIKIIAALSVSSLLSGCIVVATPLNADHHIEKKLNLDAEGLSSLMVEAGAGSMKVQGVNGLDEIQVFADIYTDSKYKNNVEISLEEVSGNGVLIAKTKSRKGFWIGSSPHIDLVVKVPQKMMLDISDGSGWVDVSNIGASVKINDGSGDIEVSKITGPITINDGSGEIVVSDVVGSVTIDDGSGEMELTDIQGDLDISDGSGGIYAKNITGTALFADGSGDMEIRSISGEVTVDDGSGDIDINGAGGLKIIESGSGGLKVKNVEGNFDIDS